MKRLGYFLALVLVGALVLWWIDRRSTRPTPSVGDADAPTPLAPAPPQHGELTTIETSKDKSGQFAHSGPFEVFLKDLEQRDQPLWLHVKARDSRTIEDGSIDLLEVEFERYDDTTRELVVDGRAGRARARITGLGAIDKSTPIEVRDVELRHTSASRYSPLRFQTPQLRLDIDKQFAESDEMVAVTGPGFVGSGRGLAVDGLAQVLTLRSEASARLELDGGGEALLVGRGALVARARPDLEESLGKDVVSIELEGGASLSLRAGIPLDVEAQSLVLFGRIDQENSSFKALHAQASREVLVRSRADGTFRSERLLVDFDAGGRALRAAFDGQPRLQLALRDRSLARVPSELLVEGEQLTVEGEGAGPLELFFETQERFEFHGPAKLTLPALGTELRCQTRFEGQIAPNGSLDELVALGAVRAQHAEWTMASERVVVEKMPGATGQEVVRLSAPELATLSGRTAELDDVSLGSGSGLVVEVDRDRALVRQARDITLEQAREGARTYWARADELYELDPRQLSFLAGGDVRFEGPQGAGRGERLEAWAVDRAELFGAPQAPARLVASEDGRTWGSFEALFIEAQGQLVHARGDARARVDLEELRYDLGAPWIVVAQRGASEQPLLAPDLQVDAGGGVRVKVVRDDDELELYGERFHARADLVRDEQQRERYEPSLSTVSGDVRFTHRGRLEMSGAGEQLELRADRSARLTPLAGEKVRLKGRLPKSDATIEMLAAQADFSPERVTALSVEADITGLALGPSADRVPPQARKVRVVAGALDCDERSIVLSESVYIGGKTDLLEDWDVDCGAALIRLDDQRADEARGQLNELVAWNGFQLRMSSMGSARGSMLEISSRKQLLTITGDAAHDESGMASLERGDTLWEAPRIELQLDTGYLRSDNAVVRPLALDARDSWTLSYEALEPLPAGDDTIQIFRNPVWRSGEVEVRAGWALAWVDSAKWRMLGARSSTRGVDPDLDTLDRRRRFFGRADMSEVQDWLHEIYLDGEVEQRVSGETQLRAAGMYMDLVDGHGWIVDAVLDFNLPIGGRSYKLKLRADWLRHSLDGSMETRNAVATTCSHGGEPHYVIRIGRFARTPRMVESTVEDPRTGVVRTVEKFDGFDVVLEDNAIDFFGPFALPLPRIAGRQNKNNKFDEESLSVGSIALPSFGQDSKFGTFISANFTTDIGPIVKGFHWVLNRLFSGKVALPTPEGNTRTHADLNSRGLVLGVESTFQAKDHYRWSVIFDAIYDVKQDRGLVRVDGEDRSDVRAWLRSRGRFLLGTDEWLDFIVTRQSDPGVQAEFFEGDYLRFEERETLIHWRRAIDERYTSATAEMRLEDFRSEVVDQPTVNIFKGRSGIGALGPLSIVQSSHLTFSNRARFEGDPRYNEQPFLDGLGEREVLRVDGLTRYETPWTIGESGVRVTPFLEGRATGWSENATQDDRAARAALIAGVQASTTFWKRFDSGSWHVWTPTLGYRGDLVHLDGSTPVARFDAVDTPIEGRYLDLAVRSRWEHRELRSDLDIEVVQTHAQSLAPGEDEGWQPVLTRSMWLSRLAGIPFGVSHDARYDLKNGETDYSRTLVGFEPTPGLDLEVGYHRGRDLSGAELYSAATVGARYRFTRKWELEGRQTFSARDSGDSLAYSMTLRRMGHDFVFELENSVVAGEGRSSLRFKFTPLFAWRNASPSMLDRWRSARQ